MAKPNRCSPSVNENTSRNGCRALIATWEYTSGRLCTSASASTGLSRTSCDLVSKMSPRLGWIAEDASGRQGRTGTVREHGEHEINQWIDAGLGGKMEGWGENSCCGRGKHLRWVRDLRTWNVGRVPVVRVDTGCLPNGRNLFELSMMRYRFHTLNDWSRWRDERRP